jgi:hypothetical protein
MENFELLETAQLELIHAQIHGRIGEDDCIKLRHQHDSVAAELLARGVIHDTAMICDEPVTDAPNYQRGFTDDVCINCAFGQLFPLCNLYDFEYIKDFTCDSFRYFEVLELEPPHGFLAGSGKQTAIASDKPLNVKNARLIVSGGEAFGVAILDEPAQIKAKEFDSEVWQKQHRITARERRQFWPNTETFFVYRFKEWLPFSGVKLWRDGRVIDEPKLTRHQWNIISKSKELPKLITLIDNAVTVTENEEFIILPEAKCDELKSVLAAAYETDVKEAQAANEQIEIYSLALVRKPRMSVSKKNFIAQEARKMPEIIEISEGIKMPFSVVKRDDEYCVINTETEKIEGCHDSEEAADEQLTALNINVTAEEENAIHTDKPKKRKPRKKKEGFLERLKSLGDTIAEFLAATPETPKTDELAFIGDAGVMQKNVNGELWHFCYSTNAFEDREGEIFSTKSLEDYVTNNEQNEEKGFFNLWHINAEDGNFNTDFARKQWQGVIGRFLVESGPYLDDEKGQAAKEFFKEFPNGHPEIAPEGWGCSPEFRYLPEERATGIYKNIWITRTSTLPRMAAANIWTETRQLNRGDTMALSEQQMKSAIEMFGQDFVDVMVSDANDKTQELEDAGVAHKDAETPSEVKMTDEQFQNLAAEIAKQFDIGAFMDTLNVVAHGLKEAREEIELLKAQDTAKARAEMPAFTFNLTRASDNDGSVVTEDDSLKEKRPAEIVKPLDPATVTPDQFFAKN